MADYPKWQISKFHNGNGQLQSVFRTDVKSEYLEVLKEWSGEIKREETVKAFDQEVKAKETSGADVCNKCGAEMVVNPKTGKRFCSNKCWLNKQKSY